MAKFLKGGGSALYWRAVTDAAGDPVVDGKYVQLPFTTESFNPGGEFINSNAIMGSRTRGHGDVGNIIGDGSLDTEISFENLFYVFAAALGNYDSGTPKRLLPSNDDLPAYDVFINHGGVMWSQYESCKVNSLRASYESNAVFTVSIDMVGMKGENVVAPNMGDDEVPLGDGNHLVFPKALVGSNTIFMSFGNATTLNVRDYITALEFTINNNNDVDTDALDAQGRLAIIPGEFTVTGSMELLVPTTGTLFDELKAAKIGTNWKSLEIKMASTSPSYAIDIFLQHIYLTDVNHDVADFGKVPFSIDFTCVRDASEASDDLREPINIEMTTGTPAIVPLD